MAKERTFVGEAVRGVKNATYLAKKAIERKVKETGVGGTISNRTNDLNRLIDNQTTDSNNR